MSTIADLLKSAAARLDQAGVDDARRDTRLLMAAAIGRTGEYVFAHPDHEPGGAERAKFASLLERRLKREPVSRIIGEREFWSLPFKLNRATLDPRPDSETLIEAVLERLSDRRRDYRLLDLGTGSGCLMAALLTEYRNATGVAVDASADAVEMALENFRNLGLTDRVETLVGGWAAAAGQTFDVVISNPPYIAEADIAGLAPEVSLYDPRPALSAGADGLDAYRALGPAIHGYLGAGAIAVVELGAGQFSNVSDLFQAADLRIDGSKSDLAGRERCIICSRAKDLSAN